MSRLQNFLKKIIVYSLIKDKKKKKTNFSITDLTTCIKTITRQTPGFILTNKKNLIGMQTTLRDKKLKTFLTKLLNFTLPKFYSNSLLTKKLYSIDKNYNATITLKNQTYFFEYLTTPLVDVYYTINIKLVFNPTINNNQKLVYIHTHLNKKQTKTTQKHDYKKNTNPFS